MTRDSGSGAWGSNRHTVASPISPGFSAPGSGSGGNLPFALLPLRLFLGITFVYASLDKLTDHAFLSASGPGSIGDLMHSVHAVAGLPALVDLALKSPVGFGYAIALGELAVGAGTILGLFARVAAAGGAVISLCLWLTVSWSTTPYYYGNDLVYLMAWLPLVLGGAPLASLDVLLSRRRRTAAMTVA